MASIRADASRSSLPNAWVKAPARSFPKPRAERSDAASTDRVTCRSRFPGRPGEFPGIPVARPGLGWHAVRPLARRPQPLPAAVRDAAGPGPRRARRCQLDDVPGTSGLRQELIRAQRDKLAQLYRDGEISDDIRRSISRSLDFREPRPFR